MSVLFVILVILAIYHFIWESIVLPQIRLELRYKLFQLRDELISLKISKNSEIPDDSFSLLEEKICVTIKRLPFFNISSVYDAQRKYAEDVEFKRIIAERKSILEKCKIDQFHQINNKLLELGTNAFFLNAGGWLYLFFPITILSRILSYFVDLMGILNKKIKNQVFKIQYSKDNEFDTFPHSLC